MAANLRVAVEYASMGAGAVASESSEVGRSGEDADTDPGGSLDERYLRLLVTRAQRLKVSPGVITQKLPPLDSSLPADTSSDTCRACKQPVDMGDILGIAKCSNGHQWCKLPYLHVELRLTSSPMFDNRILDHHTSLSDMYDLSRHCPFIEPI